MFTARDAAGEEKSKGASVSLAVFLTQEVQNHSGSLFITAQSGVGGGETTYKRCAEQTSRSCCSLSRDDFARVELQALHLQNLEIKSLI